MKIKCSVSREQYQSIKEDISYLEGDGDKQILQPATCCFLKQVSAQAEIKLARRREKCRAFSGYGEETHTPEGGKHERTV